MTINTPNIQYLLVLNINSIEKSYDLKEKRERQRSYKDLKSLFFKIISEISPDLFIHSGIGNAEMSLRKRLPDARVVAFRSEAESQKCQSSSIECGIEYIDQAAGELSIMSFPLISESGSGNDTFVCRNTSKMSQKLCWGCMKDVVECSAAKKKCSEDDVYLRKIKIPSERMDSLFLPHQFKNCCLWIDGKGASSQTIHGAQHLISRASAVFFQVEDCPVRRDQWLSGHVIDHFWGKGLAPVARDFQSRYQYNIIFLRNWWLGNSNIRYFLTEYRRIISENKHEKRKTPYKRQPCVLYHRCDQRRSATSENRIIF